MDVVVVFMSNQLQVSIIAVQSERMESDQSICVSLTALRFSLVCLNHGQNADLVSLSRQVMAFSWRECVLSRKTTAPPAPILNPSPLSHHNIVSISPLRLNPSLPVRCGKRHFENEIGYINSSAITLAIAFLLFSSSETRLTSATTPTSLTKCKGERQHMRSAVSTESSWERVKGNGGGLPVIYMIHSWLEVSSNQLLRKR